MTHCEYVYYNIKFTHKSRWQSINEDIYCDISPIYGEPVVCTPGCLYARTHTQRPVPHVCCRRAKPPNKAYSGGGESLRPCAFLRTEKANTTRLFLSLLISLTATCLYSKMIPLHFIPPHPCLWKTPAFEKSTNPLHGRFSYRVALGPFVRAERSFWVHVCLWSMLARANFGGLAWRR